MVGGRSTSSRRHAHIWKYSVQIWGNKIRCVHPLVLRSPSQLVPVPTALSTTTAPQQPTSTPEPSVDVLPTVTHFLPPGATQVCFGQPPAFFIAISIQPGHNTRRSKRLAYGAPRFSRDAYSEPQPMQNTPRGSQIYARSRVPPVPFSQPPSLT